VRSPIGVDFSTDFSTEIVHPFAHSSGRLTKRIERTYAASPMWVLEIGYGVFHSR
jgi:hypothetical protein